MSQICGIDFTYPADKISTEELKAHLKEWCKKWVFQKEKGDTGYLHYQGRCSLIKKRRMNELKGKFMLGGHITPTSTTEFGNGSFSYVLKADTRIEGPWDDTNVPPPELTPRMKKFMSSEMYPWQKRVVELCQVYEERKIHVVIDKVGNIGKSALTEYLFTKNIARVIPSFRSYEDISQFVCSMQVKAQAFIIDMPRGMKKDKLGEFYSGLEGLKNGYVFDKRYAGKDYYFRCPQIIVFTNFEPDLELLSPDRWVLLGVGRKPNNYLQLVHWYYEDVVYDPVIQYEPVDHIKKKEEDVRAVLQGERPPLTSDYIKDLHIY